MSERSFLLVHSPLVGPSSLRRLGAAIADSGHQVALPDLTAVATAPQAHVRYLVDASAGARSLTFPPVIVGHSGAGAFLPAVAEMIGEWSAVIFVDAVLPAPTGLHETAENMKVMLDQQTENGLLAPWLDWWPTGVVSQLLPDQSDRAELAADMPRLPRSFYDVAIDLPVGWSEGCCAYLQLSSAYLAEREEAASRGWPTSELDSTHLGVHTEPERVRDAIVSLTDQLVSPSS